MSEGSETRVDGPVPGGRRAPMERTTLPADPFEAVLAARARKREPSGGELGGGELRQVELDLLDPSPRNPRREFAEEPLAELADSIAAVGLIEPLAVTPSGDSRFAVVAGERRLRALRALAAAGKLSPTHPVPVRVLESLTESEHVVLSLVENLQRQDLHPLEEAEAFARLKSEHGFTTEQLARQTGRSQRWVQLRLALVELAPEARLAFAVGELGLAHARRLAPLAAGEQARALAAVRARPAAESASEALERVVRHRTPPGARLPTLRVGTRVESPAEAEERARALASLFAPALGARLDVALSLAAARCRAARTGQPTLEVFASLRTEGTAEPFGVLLAELATTLARILLSARRGADHRLALDLAQELGVFAPPPGPGAPR